jgi:DNA (cytosine-5)-methyltransferase 1
MEQLGYTNYYQVLNAKDYGIPQNRERVFTISIRKDINKVFTFPQKQELKQDLKSFLKNIPYTDVKEEYKEFSNFIIFNRKTDDKLINGIYNRVWRMNGYVGTIPARHNVLKIGEIIDNKLYYRILKTEETFKLMGFDDEDYERAAKINSNTQLYKQAGNSIVVNVLEAIVTNLLLNTEQEKEGQLNIYDYLAS